MLFRSLIALRQRFTRPSLEKNVARLERMAKSDNPQVASLAAIVLDIARAKPYKTRRLKFLAHKHPDLLSRLRDTGLIFPNN